jgi:hypothetical protein
MRHDIKMSKVPMEVGKEFFGERQIGNVIYGRPFRVIGEATREEFVAQFGPWEMTKVTMAFLMTHNTLYFYHTGKPESLAGLIAYLAYEGSD